ncbi:MAG: hypothetical protein RIC87_09895 [Kiloniellales bacterium]
MPTNIKIGLSLVVVIVAGIIAWSDFAGPDGALGYIIVAIAAVMLLGLWVFPEAGGGKPDKKAGR